MSDKADSLCEKINDNTLATSSEEDMAVSDSVLDSDEESNNITKKADAAIQEGSIVDPIIGLHALFQEGNNIDDEHHQYKKNTEELLKWIISNLLSKKRKAVENAINSHLDGKGELPISMFSM